MWTRITGHRGAAELAPENTLEGFAQAIELGCDAVELDVHMTADGHLAVIHDGRLERTTDGSGSVAELSWDQLQDVDAGAGQRIPALEAVLDLVAVRGLCAQIELKGPGTELPVCAVLSRRRAQRVRLTSFYHRRVLATADLVPAADRGVLIGCYPVDPVAIMKAARASVLHVRCSFIDVQLVTEVHGAGWEVAAWSVPSEVDEIDRLLSLGVDHLGSNRPDLALRRRMVIQKKSGASKP